MSKRKIAENGEGPKKGFCVGYEFENTATQFVAYSSTSGFTITAMFTFVVAIEVKKQH
jgi:hypothetical protein